MSTPLLVTKLYVPRPRAEAVSRPRLVERLETGQRRLTLISAPAGFGKTSLISEWIATTTRPTAWVSLDEGDSDPARFLAYVIAAIQTVAPALGQAANLALQTSSPPTDLVLATLVNELAAWSEPMVVVLDDYHRVDSSAVDAAVTFLLGHLPPQFQVVIVTREDPRLPLSRLRASGQVTELRVADLRFTAPEAAEFFTQVMGLHLSATDIDVLEARTEGWIAGLQLAGLSVQGRPDASGFIRQFAGGDRYIVEYLIEEVLQRQTETVRNFLLQTSILDRLHGSLCDAVTERDDSRKLLETLDRGNLFVVSLDDHRQWFRYHHLFADVLRIHVADEPLKSAELHGRASEWFARNGHPLDAIRHAHAAGDLARVADLLELSTPEMRRARQEASLLEWLRMLPADLVHARPVLCVIYAGVLLSCGELDGVESYLRHAARWLNETTGATNGLPPPGMVVVDDVEFQRLPVWLAIYGAGLALVQGDLATTVQQAQWALDLVADDDHLSRGAASALLGLALWTTGELESAYQSYSAGMTSLRQAGNIADTVGGVIGLAEIRITQGRLHDAMRIYQDALQIASEHGALVLRGTADMYVGMSEVCLEWGDTESASQHLAHCMALGEAVGFPQHRYRLRVMLARGREAKGDLAGAIALLDEAERLYVSDFYPNVRPIAATKARMLVAQNRLGEAWHWAREHHLSADNELSYLREYEHITLARVMLAEFRASRDATVLERLRGLLDRLADATTAGGRIGNLIEILILQALVHAERKDRARSSATLERVMGFAAPEGYVGLFVSEGAPMANLLAEAASRGPVGAQAARVLAAFDDVALPVAPVTGIPTQGHGQAPIEPLTARELEVLRLIAQGLSNQQISERLYIALSTVKGYNRAIFDKLGASRRTEAVARATECGLL